MEQNNDIKSNNFTLYYRCILCQLCRFMDSKTIEVKLIVMIKNKFKKDICSLNLDDTTKCGTPYSALYRKSGVISDTAEELLMGSEGGGRSGHV